MKKIAALVALIIGLFQFNSANAVSFVNGAPHFGFQFLIEGDFQQGQTYIGSFSFSGVYLLSSDPLEVYNQTGDWHDIPTIGAYVSVLGATYYEFWHPSHVTSIPRCYTRECGTGTFGTFSFDEDNRSIEMIAWLQAYLASNSGYGWFSFTLPDGFVARFPDGIAPYADHFTPIPATFPLFASGLGVLALICRRCKKQRQLI